MMAFADHLGGTVTIANLRPDQITTTIESKTNFFAAAPIGDVLTAECIPLHRGRTTMWCRRKITRGDGKLAALVTQTQLVMTPSRRKPVTLALQDQRRCSTLSLPQDTKGISRWTCVRQWRSRRASRSK